MAPEKPNPTLKGYRNLKGNQSADYSEAIDYLASAAMVLSGTMSSFAPNSRWYVSNNAEAKFITHHINSYVEDTLSLTNAQRNKSFVETHQDPVTGHIFLTPAQGSQSRLSVIAKTLYNERARLESEQKSPANRLNEALKKRDLSEFILHNTFNAAHHILAASAPPYHFNKEDSAILQPALCHGFNHYLPENDAALNATIKAHTVPESLDLPESTVNAINARMKTIQALGSSHGTRYCIQVIGGDSENAALKHTHPTLYQFMEEISGISITTNDKSSSKMQATITNPLVSNETLRLSIERFIRPQFPDAAPLKLTREGSIILRADMAQHLLTILEKFMHARAQSPDAGEYIAKEIINNYAQYEHIHPKPAPQPAPKITPDQTGFTAQLASQAERKTITDTLAPIEALSHMAQRLTHPVLPDKSRPTESVVLLESPSEDTRKTLLTLLTELNNGKANGMSAHPTIKQQADMKFPLLIPHATRDAIANRIATLNDLRNEALYNFDKGNKTEASEIVRGALELYNEIGISDQSQQYLASRPFNNASRSI